MIIRGNKALLDACQDALREGPGVVHIRCPGQLVISLAVEFGQKMSAVDHLALQLQAALLTQLFHTGL